jgi:hypothetical protein
MMRLHEREYSTIDRRSKQGCVRPQPWRSYECPWVAECENGTRRAPLCSIVSFLFGEESCWLGTSGWYFHGMLFYICDSYPSECRLCLSS